MECPGDAEVHSFVKRLRHKAWARCGFLSKGRPQVDFSNKLGDRWTRNWDFHQLLRNIYLFLVDHGSVGFGRFEYKNFMKLPIVGFHKPCADASKLTLFLLKLSYWNLTRGQLGRRQVIWFPRIFETQKGMGPVQLRRWLHQSHEMHPFEKQAHTLKPIDQY